MRKPIYGIPIGGGGGGECTRPHVIEVEALPEVGEEGSYYALKTIEDEDVVLYQYTNGEYIPLEDEYEGVVTVIEGDPELQAPINAYAAELGTLVGGASTPVGVKTDIENLTTAANTATGKADENLTDAVNSLIDGQGITPSGYLDITENGTFDVTDKAGVNVTVPIPDGYIVPSGSVTIVENGTHDVSGYASAEVNITIPEPALEELTVTENGEYTPTGDGFSKVTVNVENDNIIEVDELPETGEEDKVYKYQNAYYEYTTEFSDILVSLTGTMQSYQEYMEAQGKTLTFNTLPTKTTEGISASDTIFYYIEDEEDVFVYNADGWASFSTLVDKERGGIVLDISSAVSLDCYYMLFASKWVMYPEVNGALDITENGTFDVTNKVSVNVNVESGGGIIEVDELPEVGVEGVVYKCQGKLYEYLYGFTDVLVYFNLGSGQFVPFGEFATSLGGGTFKAHTIPTKTTEGIFPTTDTEIHLYFIEDENDVFAYQADSWVSMGGQNMGAFGGIVNDISEATDETCYYALFTSKWIMYPAVSGTVYITENGERDVTYFETVNIEVPNNAICGAWNIEACDSYTLLDNVFQGNFYVNFTTVWNGEVKKCIGIRCSYGGDSMYYMLEDGGEIVAYSLGWSQDSTGHYPYYVNFGKEPQIISTALANFLEKGTPIYDNIVEVTTEDEMNALLETAEEGAVFKYTGPTTDTYKNGSLYIVHTPMISFTIDGTEYQAEEGMAWAEWCASKYNTIGCINDSVEEFIYNSDTTKYLSVSDIKVYGKYLINANAAYVFVDIFVEEPNEYGTTVIINQYGEEDNDYGTTVIAGEDANIITFAISGTNYKAKELTTWGKWIDSKYNTDGYKLYGNKVVSKDDILVIENGRYGVYESSTVYASGVYALAETELAGTWMFNEHPADDTDAFDLDFISNGVNYSSIRIQAYIDNIGKTVAVYYDDTLVYDEETRLWVDPAYRTITITSKLIDAGARVLYWIKSSAIRQDSIAPISFTIADTTYQAEEGMTFGEWVESDYNTGSFISVDGGNRIMTGSSSVYADSRDVYATDTIIANKVYTLNSMSSG